MLYSTLSLLAVNFPSRRPRMTISCLHTTAPSHLGDGLLLSDGYALEKRISHVITQYQAYLRRITEAVCEASGTVKTASPKIMLSSYSTSSGDKWEEDVFVCTPPISV
jgi:hypothetical protein